MSRATLRDAIAALRQAGLVETTRGRTGGTVVVRTGPTPESAVGPDPERHAWPRVDDALAFRRVVEPGAAALAAASPVPAERAAALRRALADVQDAADDGARRVADARLHLAVATLSGSAMLVEAVTRAQAVLSELLARIPVLEVNIAHSDAQHAAVVDAVLHGDPAAARHAMEEHCDATSALLRGLLT